MREKMARAMALKHAKSLSPSEFISKETSYEAFVESGWRNWLDQADAALDAMREPTEGVHVAINNAIGDGMNYAPYVWQAGIDAAKAGA